MSGSELFLLTVAAAALNLDKQVFGPFMLSRPLMAGFIMGLLSGQLEAGIWMGLAAELLWLAVMPLGGQLTPHSGLAVSAVFLAWLVGFSAPAAEGPAYESGLVFSFLTIVFWARAFTWIDRAARALVPPQLQRARQALAEGRDPRFFQRNLVGLGATFVFSFLALAAAVAFNSALLTLLIAFVPEHIWLSLSALYRLIPFLGLLGMAVVYLEKSVFPFYLASLLVSLLAIGAVY